MKTLQEENIKELTENVLDIIAKASIELGHRTDAKTMAALAKIFANDLQKENRFKCMTINQIQDAFHIGVRYCDFEPFINIKTFFRFIINHKKTINDAYYQVHTLNQNPRQVPFYQEPLKLLK
mgnify:FL=1|jgi:hypothetical protein|tara:strand:+ start:215 stop:583 length:369 start_codon:yes stop_codon:yes gene_type:complete